MQYKKIYKENILPSFIKLIDPNLEYYYQKYQKYKPYKIYNEKTQIDKKIAEIKNNIYKQVRDFREGFLLSNE